MKIIKEKSQLKENIKKIKIKGQSIGFVPTMGFLHEGHMKLIKASKEEADVTVVSIFVNPTQFDKKNDFESYPINLEEDFENCKNLKVDIVFLPDVRTIYPDGFPEIFIKIPHLMQNLCAKHRKGHMEGVLLIVSILFHLVEPDFSFFGKKDYQQYLLVKYITKVLAFSIEIIGVETQREENGLAMSSRNNRLNEIQRKEASLIFQILCSMKNDILAQRENFEIIKQKAKEKIKKKGWNLDYIEILDAENLSPKNDFGSQLIIAIAVFIKDVRLIDNLTVK